MRRLPAAPPDRHIGTMLDENLTSEERGELLKLLRDTIAADSLTRAVFDKAAPDTRWPIVAQPDIGEQCKPDQDSQRLERGGDIPGSFDPRKIEKSVQGKPNGYCTSSSRSSGQK
jgi:hypothetical protein